MPKINVVKPFTLNRDNGTTSVYAVGIHDVEREDAEHWFVQAHTDKAPTSKPILGTPQYARAASALVDKRQAMLDEALAWQKEAEEAEKNYQPGTIARPDLVNGGVILPGATGRAPSGLDRTLEDDGKTDDSGQAANDPQQPPEPGSPEAQAVADALAQSQADAAEQPAGGRKKPSQAALDAPPAE